MTFASVPIGVKKVQKKKKLIYQEEEPFKILQFK